MSIGQIPQSFQGYVGIAKESSYATTTAPTDFIDAISDGFEMDNQPDFPNTTRGRAAYKGEAGPFSDEGPIDMPVNPENGIGLLLLAAFGSESFTSLAAGTGEHTFQPADTLDSLSVEVDRDQDVVRHVGVGIDALELSHASEDWLTASVDAIAQGPDYSVSSATPSYSDLRNFRFHDATVTTDGNDRSPDVQDVTAGIENNLDGLYRNSREINKIDVGERVFTASATLDFESVNLFEKFLGAASATAVQDTLANVAFNAVWTSPETTADGNNYKLEWDMPTCTINTHNANINQNDLVAENVEFRALVDIGGLGHEAEAILTNGVTSSY